MRRLIKEAIREEVLTHMKKHLLSKVFTIDTITGLKQSKYFKEGGFIKGYVEDIISKDEEFIVRYRYLYLTDDFSRIQTAFSNKIAKVKDSLEEAIKLHLKKYYSIKDYIRMEGQNTFHERQFNDERQHTRVKAMKSRLNEQEESSRSKTKKIIDLMEKKMFVKEFIHPKGKGFTVLDLTRGGQISVHLYYYSDSQWEEYDVRDELKEMVYSYMKKYFNIDWTHNIFFKTFPCDLLPGYEKQKDWYLQNGKFKIVNEQEEESKRRKIFKYLERNMFMREFTVSSGKAFTVIDIDRIDTEIDIYMYYTCTDLDWEHTRIELKNRVLVYVKNHFGFNNSNSLIRMRINPIDPDKYDNTKKYIRKINETNN